MIMKITKSYPFKIHSIYSFEIESETFTFILFKSKLVKEAAIRGPKISIITIFYFFDDHCYRYFKLKNSLIFSPFFILIGQIFGFLSDIMACKRSSSKNFHFFLHLLFLTYTIRPLK